MTRLLTISETANRLSLGVSTVRNLIDTGTLISCRVGPRGGSIRIREEDLEAYVQSTRLRKTLPSPTPRTPRKPVSDLAAKYFPKLYGQRRP